MYMVLRDISQHSWRGKYHQVIIEVTLEHICRVPEKLLLQIRSLAVGSHSHLMKLKV